MEAELHKVATISLGIADGMLRVVTETDTSSRDFGIDLSDGYQEAADAVLKEVLGEIARLDWERRIRLLVQTAT